MKEKTDQMVPTEVVASDTEPTTVKKSFGAVDVLLGVLLGILLCFFTLLLLILIFLGGVAAVENLPKLGPLSPSTMTAFCSSGIATAIGVLLVLLPLAAIVTMNLRAITKPLMTVGVTSLATALFTVLMALFAQPIVSGMSADWRVALANSTLAFQGFFGISTLWLIGIGATCLSVRACMKAAKGDAT